MSGAWDRVRQAAELNDHDDELRRVVSLEEAVAENHRLDRLLEQRVAELERAVAGLLGDAGADGAGTPDEA